MSSNPQHNIYLSAKQAPLGKPSGYPSHLAHSWETCQFSSSSLIDHMLAGKPICVSHFHNGYRNRANFIRSNFFALDIDESKHGAPLTDAELQAVIDYAESSGDVLAVLPSASDQPNAHKLRILFHANRVITDGDEYRYFANLLMIRFELFTPALADKACRDESRMFYGARPGSSAYYVNDDALLDLVAMDERMTQLTLEAAKAETTPRKRDKPKLKRASVQRQARAAETKIRREDLQQVIESQLKIDRVDHRGETHADCPFCNKIAKPGHNHFSVNFQKEGYYCFVCEAQGHIVGLARHFGYEVGASVRIDDAAPKHPQSEEPPSYGELQQMKRQAWKSLPYEKKIQSNDVDLNTVAELAPPLIETTARYLDRVVVQEGINAIKSPMGTGKTHLIEDLIPQYERVLVVVHRQSLAHHLANRLGIPCYLDYEYPYELRALDQLVICANSLHKLEDPENGLSAYDLVVIDEAEQVFPHLSSRTFNSADALQALEMIRYYLEVATVGLVMDANLSEVIPNWIHQAIREDVRVIENHWRPPQAGEWVMYEHRHTLLEKAIEMVKAGKRIAIATGKEDSIRISRHLKTITQDRLVVNQDTVSQEKIQTFLKHPDDHMPQVLIFSPTIGSGVDIQTEMDAVFLIDNTGQLAATDGLQMMGRFRNCTTRYSYVKPFFKGQRDTAPASIFETRKRLCDHTARRAGFDRDGQRTYTPEQLAFEELQAHFDAAYNRSMNNLPTHLYALALDDQWQVTFNEEKPHEETVSTNKQITKKHKAEEREGVLTAPIVLPRDYDDANRGNQMTPEIRQGHTKYHLLDYQGLITPEVKEQLETNTLDDDQAPTLTEVAYDSLKSPTTRAQLDRYCSLFLEDEQLADFDRQETDELLRRRHHFLAHKNVIRSLYQTLWGDDPTREYEAEELGRVFAQWKNSLTDDERAFLTDAFKKQTAYMQIRNILTVSAGIPLRRHERKVPIEGERKSVYSYSVDMIELGHWNSWRDKRTPRFIEQYQGNRE